MEPSLKIKIDEYEFELLYKMIHILNTGASRRGGKPPRKTKKHRNPKKSRKLMSRRQKYSRRK